MKITGKVKLVTPDKVSEKGYKSRGILLVYNDNGYDREVLVEVTGENVGRHNFDVHIGEIVEVDVNLTSRQWNGNYYTNCRVWALSHIADAPTTPSIPTAKQPAQTYTAQGQPFRPAPPQNATYGPAPEPNNGGLPF